MIRAEYHADPGGPTTAPRVALRVGAVIPALDCAATIAEVVQGVRAHVDDVLVVDDGSTDETERLAAAAGAVVIRHDRNLGKGTALDAGLRWAAARGLTHAFTIDGDGQHLAGEMPAMLEAAAQNPTALVLGERRRDGHDISPAKLFGNRFANRWVEIASGRALGDTQSGFRIYPVAEALALGAHARHYGWETELLIRWIRAGRPVACRDVRVYYPPPDERISHYKPWLDTVRIIFLVVGIILGLRRPRRRRPAA